jgi:hypothetical protein
MVAIAFSASLSPLPLDVVITEKHTSELDITEIPIESGSRITDHAFVLPKKLTLEAASENAAAAYNALVAIQETRAPFTLVTGLYVYTNMLIKQLSATRDKIYSRVLNCSVELQEILIASTSGDAPMSDPETIDRASGPVNRGDAGAITVSAADAPGILSGLFP